MIAPIEITISGNASEHLKKISDPSAVLASLRRTMDAQNQITVGHIKTAHLSGPTGEHSLTPRSYRYRQSLRRSDARFSGGGIESSIGTNVLSAGGVSYPAIHEFGMVVPSRPTRAKNKSYAKKHPMTKAYSIPARAPIQTGIEERLDQYSQAFSETILNPK